ncbi:MAG: hypothetical protein PF690_18660 [Deltaproteobacteria bacterium]|jgi:hypothetical protein|nr:hypothetical protein [Deltaproteobacteria bacterium]
MKKYPDWENISDAMRMSDEWDEWRYNLEYEINSMQDEEIFIECKDQNFGQEYLRHAENTIIKNDAGDSRTLLLIDDLRESIKDQEACLIFMKALQIITITNRAGIVPKLAQTQAEMKEGSGITWEIKKRVIRAAISHIFKKYPEMKKTLGTVWNKFDIVNKDQTFEAPKNKINKFGKGVYRVKRGKDEKGNKVVFITKNNEPFREPYKKRSLQNFIDELK